MKLFLSYKAFFSYPLIELWIVANAVKRKKMEWGGMGVNSKIWLRFFIYTTKKILPYRTDLSVGLECVKKNL